MATTYIPGAGYYDNTYLAGMGGYGGASYGSTYGVPTTQMGGVSPQFAAQTGLLAAAGGGGGGMGGSSGIGGSGAGRDPETSAALALLRQIMDGKVLPYDEATRTAMTTKASDMNASAEGAAVQDANESAAVGGASASDPSLAAARREFMARRQSGNASAANAIDQQANRANFGARMDAATTVAAYDAARQRQQYEAMRDMYQMQYGGGRGSGGGGGGQYDWSQVQGAGSRPSTSIRPSGFGGSSLYAGDWRNWQDQQQPDANAGYGNWGGMAVNAGGRRPYSVGLPR